MNMARLLMQFFRKHYRSQLLLLRWRFRRRGEVLAENIQVAIPTFSTIVDQLLGGHKYAPFDAACPNPPAVLKHLKVLHNHRQGHAERTREFAHRGERRSQALHDGATRGVGQGLEDAVESDYGQACHEL